MILGKDPRQIRFAIVKQEKITVAGASLVVWKPLLRSHTTVVGWFGDLSVCL